MISPTDFMINGQVQWIITKLKPNHIDQLKNKLRHTFSEYCQDDGAITDDMAAFFLRTTVRTMLLEPWIGEDIKSLERDDGFNIFVKIHHRINQLPDEQKKAFVQRYKDNHRDGSYR